MNNEISSIHKAIDERQKESSNQDKNKVKSVRKRKIRLIDSKYESDRDTAKDTESSEWIMWIESENISRRVQL